MRTSLLIVLVAAGCSDAASVPRWTNEPGTIERGRIAATDLGASASARHAKARAQVIAKQAWCRRLPAEELDHTPFDHREDVIAVSAEHEGGRIRGARIRFASVPGLTAAWLHRTLLCHRDIAAATGFDPTYLPTSPAGIAGATTTVLEDPSGPIVVVWADDPEAAATIYDRAEALLGADQAHDHSEHEH